jgi:hypothetical protein
METTRSTLLNSIADAEDTEGKNAGAKVARYCDPENTMGTMGKHHQLCDQLTEITLNYSNSCDDLAVWLYLWKWITPPVHLSCQTESPPANQINAPVSATQVSIVLAQTQVSIVLAQLQWAIVLAQVFSTAVLPLFYGVLGAGAAVVRDIWREMRDSLLSPRDSSLSWGKLALGAVIGVSIGLFISPQSTTGYVPLTPSALSFVAGFGVEGVFVMLETLIRRVFNIQQPPHQTASP